MTYPKNMQEVNLTFNFSQGVEADDSFVLGVGTGDPVHRLLG